MDDGVGTTTYTYNAITGTPTLGAGRLASVDGPLDDDEITYTYDEMGRVASRSIDGMSNETDYEYDDLGRLITVTNPLGEFDYAYVDVSGRLDHVDYPNGQVTNYSYYNNAGDKRLHEIENLTPSPSNLSKFTYAYDANGTIQSWAKKWDAGSTFISNFKYDAVDQLTDAEIPGMSTTKHYAYRYDAAGNRTSEQIDLAVEAATHNRLNQLTALSDTGPIRFAGTLNEAASVTVNGVSADVDGSNRFAADVVLEPGMHAVDVVATDGSSNVTTNTYDVTVASGSSRALKYDANGNLIDDGNGRTFTWYATNQLASISENGDVTEFVYDGKGRRVQEKLNSTLIKQWVWCDDPQPCEERDDGDVVTKRFYPQGEEMSGDPYYFTKDHLGSIREMIDAMGSIQARYDYDPYGGLTKVSGSLDADFGFTGFYAHNSDLLLTLYRAYCPSLGRWLSRDEFSENEGKNLYDYVLNNPVNNLDPLGLQVEILLEPPPITPRPIIPPEMIDEALKLNGGRNRVSIPDGRDVDLAGKPHFDKTTGGKIDTPHTHEPQPKFDPPYENIPRGSNPVPRPSTVEDIKDVLRYLKNGIKDFVSPSQCEKPVMFGPIIST